MSNKKITQLPINGNPTFSDVFPIVNDGITKQLSLTGLTAFIGPYINTVTPPFTGGTVSGATTFINGLSANTISATTYVNLPTDIRVTGGTVSEDSIIFKNNTGGTFSVTGFTIGSGPISISGTTLYSNNPQTYGFSTSNTIAFGLLAGRGAINGYGSNFLGANAGNLATNAAVSNFLGINAGFQATNATGSNFLGSNAGNGASGGTRSNFLGESAGSGALNASYSNFLGSNAGNAATNANNSNFIGESAGGSATNASNSNFIGQNAGQGATDSQHSNFIGQNSGNQATNASNSNFIGGSAGNYATNANNSNFIGESAGNDATGANYSNFFGRRTGQFAINAAYSTFIGYNVGASFTGNELGSNNIIIGTNISLPDNTVNSINLGGILFGTGAYSDSNGDPSITPTSNGRIGVGVVLPTANLHIAASTTASALMRLEVGSAPSSPNDGDIWLESNTLTGLKIRISGVTRTITIS